MIHAYIGDGKGKSTAAIGLLIRACGAGLRVGAVLFDKGSETYRHHEEKAMQALGIPYLVTGMERMQPDGRFRFGVIDADSREAARGLALAENMIGSGAFDLVVLDEALSAVGSGLMNADALLSILAGRTEAMEVVLTGRCEDERLLSAADLVSRVQNVRHYFQKGVRARPGIEY